MVSNQYKLVIDNRNYQHSFNFIVPGNILPGKRSSIILFAFEQHIILLTQYLIVFFVGHDNFIIFVVK